MVSTEPTTPAWDKDLLKNPHAVSDKRSRVQRMFAAIALSYDLNNRLHSLWMDQVGGWKAVKISQLKSKDRVVDVACGTGDLIEAFRQVRFSSGGRVAGFGGAAVCRRGFHLRDAADCTAEKSSFLTWLGTIRYVTGDAQSLPLPDEFCDVISIAFGIRNVADPAAAIREFHRVLRRAGG